MCNWVFKSTAAEDKGWVAYWVVGQTFLERRCEGISFASSKFAKTKARLCHLSEGCYQEQGFRKVGQCGFRREEPFECHFGTPGESSHDAL